MKQYYLGSLLLFFSTQLLSSSILSRNSSNKKNINIKSSDAQDLPRLEPENETINFQTGGKDDQINSILEGRDRYRGIVSKILPPARKEELKNPEIDLTEIKDSKTLAQQEFNYIKNFMARAREGADHNKILQNRTNTLAASLDASLPDTQAINGRIKNFYKATRNVSKNMLNKLKTTELQLKNKKASLTLAQKEVITKDLIQLQLNTLMGTDSITGENKILFSPEFEKELVKGVLNNFNIFDAQQSDAARMQELASVGDMVMNTISQGQPVNATFKTVINDQGTYITNMVATNESGQTIESSTTINNSGQEVGRSLSINSQEGNGPVIYLTTMNPKTGSLRLSKTENGKNEILLTSAENTLFNVQFSLANAIILGKMMLKVSLWSTKQVAFSLLTNPIPQSIVFGAISPLVLLGKGLSLAAGYKYADPTIIATMGTIVEVTMGNRRAILSNNPDRVFTKGSTISNALNRINPLGIKEGYKPDPHEEYYAFDSDMYRGLSYGLKQMFPETFGDQLLSKAALKSPNGTSPSNTIQLLSAKFQ